MTDRDSRWEGKERQLKENNQHFWIEESVLRDWPKQETNVANQAMSCATGKTMTAKKNW